MVQDEYKQNTHTQSTVCVGVHYVQAYTNNANKISLFLQTTGGTDEPNLNIQQYTYTCYKGDDRGTSAAVFYEQDSSHRLPFL